MAKILSLSSGVSSADQGIIKLVRDSGHELSIGPDFVGAHPGDEVADELLELIPGHNALILGGVTISRKIIEGCPDLQVISRTGVGYDAVDVDAAAERQIPVLIAVGSNHTTVAEYAFGLMLVLSRQMLIHHEIVQSGAWRREPNYDLAAKTLGIAGLGRIGQALADRALAFSMKVIACEAHPNEHFIADRGIELVDIDRLCSASDFLSLHLPVTAETTGIINEDRLALMKSNAFLINTARGQLIDERALHTALVNGQIAGAGLDVFVDEPPHSSGLVQLPNVIVSPHAAGVSKESQARMGLVAVKGALQVLAGSWPREIVVNGIYSTS